VRTFILCGHAVEEQLKDKRAIINGYGRNMITYQEILICIKEQYRNRLCVNCATIYSVNMLNK